MNPRVSRSSALASKATGFPIAKIAARLAVGYSLEEIPNDITRVTPASFEPTIDYVVVKWPRFAFEKFPGADGVALDPHAVRRRGHGHRAHVQAGLRQGPALARARRREPAPPDDTEELLARARDARRADRFELLLAGLARGVEEDEIERRTGIDPWFVAELAALARGEDPEAGLARTFKAVDTCAAEFEAETPVLLLGLRAPRPRRPAPRGPPRRARPRW